MRPADPTEQFKDFVEGQPLQMVQQRLHRSAAQVTARDTEGGELEISLSPNAQVWTYVPFDFPTTFILMPGSVIWARCVRPGGDAVGVEVSIRVWPEPENFTPAIRRAKRGR